MDMLSPINRAFSLVAQEEQQRKITSTDTGNDSGNLSSGNVAFAVTDKRNTETKSTLKPQRREGVNKPYCTYCKFHGHVIDKC